MFILRIEIAKKVFYNVNLGEAYVKVSNIEDCDSDMKLGSDFHDKLSTIWDKSNNFVPSIVIFKNGSMDINDYINFDEIFTNVETPDSIRCWIMEGGNTIESFIVVNICKNEDYSDSIASVY
jgi:hypothetical protein